MSLIDKAVSHFGKGARREIEVPEWEVTLYAKNLSLEDRSSLLSRSGDDNMLYLAYSCIFGLVDENDTPVFTIGDKPKLLKSVDPEIIIRLANFVLKVESDEKN
jgi:hypothetical protein